MCRCPECGYEMSFGIELDKELLKDFVLQELIEEGYAATDVEISDVIDFVLDGITILSLGEIEFEYAAEDYAESGDDE